MREEVPLSVATQRSPHAARDLLVAAAREAGALALGFFRHGTETGAAVHTKIGGSPVTAADLAANALLKERLGTAFPDAGWLSEETADTAARLHCRLLVIVDPIDGTRAFMSGDPRWVVSAALIHDGRPIAGVVHAPALDETFTAAREAGAELNGRRISAAARPIVERFSAAGPKLILKRMQEELHATVDAAPRVPSLAYRLCLAAAGQLDFAVAGSNSHDWDIAAADLILEEAGARLVGADGRRLAYNRAEIRRQALLAVPDTLAPRLLAAFGAAASG